MPPSVKNQRVFADTVVNEVLFANSKTDETAQIARELQSMRDELTGLVALLLTTTN